LRGKPQTFADHFTKSTLFHDRQAAIE